MKRARIACIAGYVASSADHRVPAWSAAAGPAELKKDDRCAVCGMFVAKYRHGLPRSSFPTTATLPLTDRKDMFKYYLQMNKYAPARKPSDIAAVYVTEYYSAKLMDAKRCSMSSQQRSRPYG